MSRSITRRLGAGTATAAFATVLTLAVWPASEAEKANADGQNFGEAAAALYQADTQAEADDALADLRTAAEDTREHAGDALGEQADEQADALDRAADGFYGMHTTSDDWEAELWEAQLDDAVNDLGDNAAEFQEDAPETVDAFWDGVEEGYNDALDQEDV